jgi:hypothetical protein
MGYHYPSDMPAQTTTQRGDGDARTARRPNLAVVGTVLGIAWWMTMIGSLIAADLRERQPRHPRTAQSIESRQASN